MLGLVDCETTGLRAHSCGLIEFTCAVIDPQTMVEADRFKSGQIAIVPGSFTVTPEALACNGYAADVLHLGRAESEVAADFAAFVRRYGPLTFTSFNAMDWGFIEELFARHGIEMRGLFSHRRIDIQTLIVARNVMTGVPDASSSLKAAAKEFHAPAPSHTSDSDVTAAAHVMRELFALVPWMALHPAPILTGEGTPAPDGPEDLGGIFSGANTASVRGLVNAAGEPYANGPEAFKTLGEALTADAELRALGEAVYVAPDNGPEIAPGAPIADILRGLGASVTGGGLAAPEAPAPKAPRKGKP